MVRTRGISGLLAGFLMLLFSAGCRTTGIVSLDTSPAETGLVHVTRIAYSPVENGTSVRIYSTGKLQYTSYKLSNPSRLAVEIPNVILDFETKRIELDDPSISSLSVVRFPKINSVRVEMEIFSNVPFSVNSNSRYLEVVLFHKFDKKLAGSVPKTGFETTSGTPDETASLEEALEKLREESENSKLENLKSQKEAQELLEENMLLEQQLEAALAQLEKTVGMTKALKARTEFMEKKLNELQAQTFGRFSAPDLKADLALPSPTLMEFEKETLKNVDADSRQALEEIRKMLDGWLTAWNWKDLLKYSSYYASDFKEGSIDRNNWLKNKRRKFAMPGTIEVKAKKLKVTLLDTQNAVAVFKQTFKSFEHGDKGVKTLALVKKSAGWQIMSESWKPL